jgi:putative membrane protein
LARNARDHQRHHTVYLVAGLAVAWLGLESPIDWYSDNALQSVHMAQHILIGLIAPPLWLLGLSPSMAANVARLPGLRRFAEPVWAQVMFAVVMIAWHVPALYDLTLGSEGIHIFEHFTFMVGGMLFWWPVVESTSEQLRWRLGPVAKVVYIIAGTVPQDTVSLVLIFSRTPFYHFYATAPRAVAGLDALTDQTLAGIALMVAGKISYLVAMLKLFVDWVARTRAENALAA